MFSMPRASSRPAVIMASSRSSVDPIGSCSAPGRSRLASWSLAGAKAAALSALGEMGSEPQSGSSWLRSCCSELATGEAAAPGAGAGQPLMLRCSLPSAASPWRAMTRETQLSNAYSAASASPPSALVKAARTTGRTAPSCARALAMTSCSSRVSGGGSSGWCCAGSLRWRMQCSRGCADGGGRSARSSATMACMLSAPGGTTPSGSRSSSKTPKISTTSLTFSSHSSAWSYSFTRQLPIVARDQGSSAAPSAARAPPGTHGAQPADAPLPAGRCWVFLGAASLSMSMSSHSSASLAPRLVDLRPPASLTAGGAASEPAISRAAHSDCIGMGTQTTGVRCHVQSSRGRTVQLGCTSSMSRYLPVRSRASPLGETSSYAPT
mmetsp:Transcript_4609/g.11411  ORF Transcript_4609/g.11411 Transcript_4609/m.11411 type:complete len:380 (-) Transcript_4609:271-1410(-)